MPKNKNASFRYRAIDNLLRSHRLGLSIRDLVEGVSEALSEEFGIKGVSERTIREDISIMRSDRPRGYEAPIKFDRESGRYKYEDPNFSIYKLPFNEEDLQTLRRAHTVLKGLSGTPVTDIMNELMVRLEQSERVLSREPYFQIDFPAGNKGSEHIGLLINAIEDQRKVIMDYHPFSGHIYQNLEVDPWLIKAFNGRWFLVGKSRLRDAGPSVFGLDRIERISPSEVKCEKAPADLAEKFAHAIGLSVPDGAKPVDIKLKFSKERFKYVETKPIHPSQQVIERDGQGVVVGLHLIENKELISLLHFYGPDVEVMEPASLRATMAAHYQHLAAVYRTTAPYSPSGTREGTD